MKSDGARRRLLAALAGPRAIAAVAAIATIAAPALALSVEAGVATASARARPAANLAQARAVSAARRRHPVRPVLQAPNPFAGAALRAYLSQRVGNVTAAAYDVNSGVTYLYRPGVPEQTASIVKVDILATLLHETQARGGLSGAQRVIAQGMIEASDNNDATTLWNEAGGAPAVQAFDAAAGMDQTAVNLAWGYTTTTPLDQLKLLRLVMLPNRLLDPTSRAYAYDLMRNVIPADRWGVSAGLGSRATVALKNGWYPHPAGWQVNSIGQVTGSRRHYLLAVMTNGDPTEGYGITTIDRISAAAWQALAGQTVLELEPPVVQTVLELKPG